MDLMPVVVTRLLDGRVGSTLLMNLLATSPYVILERHHPTGEFRYLSYYLRQHDGLRRYGSQATI